MNSNISKHGQIQYLRHENFTNKNLDKCKLQTVLNAVYFTNRGLIITPILAKNPKILVRK